MILRCFKCTACKGLVLKPAGDLALGCWCDADFAGLRGREPPNGPNGARSRAGCITTLGGCPLAWKSQLTSKIRASALVRMSSEPHGDQSHQGRALVSPVHAL
jgi:hypothetical protein